MNERTVEQIFVRLRSGRLELLLVLENPAGARFRETLHFPTRNELEAVRRAARHVALRGEFSLSERLRLRVERAGALRDEPSLEREFANEFLRHAEAAKA